MIFRLRLQIITDLSRRFLAFSYAMKAKPRRFNSDDECLAYLKSVNPDYDYYPPEFDYGAAIRDAHALHQRLRDEFGPTVTIEDHFEDATCHAQLWLPPHTHISLSNFERLAAVAHDETVSDPLFPPIWPPPHNHAETVPDPSLRRIILILEESGYTYVPFRVISVADANLPPSWSGLACQLFDYV